MPPRLVTEVGTQEHTRARTHTHRLLELLLVLLLTRTTLNNSNKCNNSCFVLPTPVSTLVGQMDQVISEDN